MASQIGVLARRAAADTYFLASALEDYVRSERLDDDGLARLLGCQVEVLDGLRLCRRPRSEPALFRLDIDRIASHFGVDVGMLAQVVRRSDAITSLRQGAGEQRRLLMAARDRVDEHSGSEEPDEDRP